MEKPVDLRSDTVTRPTESMRRAMADAEVGDDVLGEDPTVRKLEEMTAGLLGKEAALFVPSGTMGNEIALRVQARPGDEVIVDAWSHIMNAEAGGAAALSGITLRPVATSAGHFDSATLLDEFRTDEDPHDAPTRLVCVENSHNRHGGRVYPPDDLETLGRRVHDRGARLHMDGARIWNAAAALGRTEAEIAAPADTVMACFSKGLGAPVGSVLAGTRDVIRRGLRVRKLFGGGMRQVGILAAACLHAIEHHRPGLPEDHRRARLLAERVEAPADVPLLGGVPETNILIWTLPERLDMDSLIRRLAGEGVLLSSLGPGVLRAVVHRELSDDDISAAARAIGGAFRLKASGRMATVLR